MAGNNNPATNLSDEDRSKGGKRSSEKQNMSELGKEGNKAQSIQAKRKGGEHSSGNQYTA